MRQIFQNVFILLFADLSLFVVFCVAADGKKLGGGGDGGLLDCVQVQAAHLGATFAVDASRDDASGVAGTFAAREEAADADVLQGLAVAQYAYGRRGACFGGDEYGLVGEKSVACLSEFSETFLQAVADGRR